MPGFAQLSRRTPSREAGVDEPEEVHVTDYGAIDFALFATPVNAEFVRVDLNADKGKLVDHALEKWDLEAEPSLLLRITGSLDDERSEELQTSVESIIKAASTASAWLFCNGLEFGVAKLVGDILSEHRHTCSAPLIGVQMWSAVQGRDQLTVDPKGKPAGKGKKRRYTHKAPDDNMSTISLQSGHTHFLIANDPPDPSAGTAELLAVKPEAVLLAARKKAFTFAHEFERAASERVSAPRVLTVVCGDETTLSEVLAFTQVGSGIVLLSSDTGGLAAALTSYIVDGIVPPKWHGSAREFEELKTLNANHARKYGSKLRRNSTTDDMFSASKGAASEWPLICIESDSSLLDQAILDLVILQASDTAAKVRFCVRWNDEKRLDQLLDHVPLWAEERIPILCEAIEFALELEHAPCIKALLAHKAPVKDIDLLKLYDKLYDKASPPPFQMFSGPLPTVRRAKEAAAAGLDPSAGAPGNRWSDYYPIQVWEMLSEVVPGLTLYWLAKLEGLARMNELAKKSAEEGKNPDSPHNEEHEDALREDFIVKEGAPMRLGARWIDVYVWAVLLGNHELALMLLPACQEPMRAAIIGAKLCKHMAEVLPLHAVVLNAKAAEHEDFAVTLLGLCSNFEDARRMLITKSKHWNRTVLHLAVQSGLREFCAHHHCQTLCGEWLRGVQEPEIPQVVMDTRLSPGLFGVIRIISHAIVPINWIPGTRPMTEWHLPPAMQDEVEPAELGRPPTAAFYCVPMVKQLIRLACHVVYVSLISYAAMETDSSGLGKAGDRMRLLSEASLVEGGGDIFVEEPMLDFHDGGGLESVRTDAAMWIWTIALALDEWYKYAQEPSTFQADFWNKYDYLTLCMTFGSLTTRLFSLTLSVEILAFSVLLIWCRLFKYLQLSQTIGLLVIMIMEMFNDIALWVLVSIIFIGAFTTAFVAISDPTHIETSDDHPLTVPIWAMLGTYDKNEVSRWNESIGEIMLGTYLVISQIVLVNLLIAMMGYTFGAIKENADEEWKFGRLRSVLEASERMSPLPPPFNLPQTSFALMHRMLWADLHPAIKSRILWLFGQDFETLTDEDESYDYAAAKKAKQKVAKRLLLKLRKQEEEEGPGIAGALAEIKEQNERFVDMLQAQAAQIVSLSAKVNAVPAVAKLQASSAGGAGTGAPSARAPAGAVSARQQF